MKCKCGKEMSLAEVIKESVNHFVCTDPKCGAHVKENIKKGTDATPPPQTPGKVTNGSNTVSTQTPPTQTPGVS